MGFMITVADKLHVDLNILSIVLFLVISVIIETLIYSLCVIFIDQQSTKDNNNKKNKPKRRKPVKKNLQGNIITLQKEEPKQAVSKVKQRRKKREELTLNLFNNLQEAIA